MVELMINKFFYDNFINWMYVFELNVFGETTLIKKKIYD